MNLAGLGLLAAALASQWPAQASGPEPAAEAVVAEAGGNELQQGEAAYARTCVACHGEKGSGAKGPPLVPFVYLEAQVMAIVRGGQGEMPPMPVEAVSDDEMFAVMAYLMALEDAQH